MIVEHIGRMGVCVIGVYCQYSALSLALSWSLDLLGVRIKTDIMNLPMKSYDTYTHTSDMLHNHLSISHKILPPGAVNNENLDKNWINLCQRLMEHSVFEHHFNQILLTNKDFWYKIMNLPMKSFSWYMLSIFKPWASIRALVVRSQWL
jgi:hypothetical protein